MTSYVIICPHHPEVCVSQTAKYRAASPTSFSPSSLWEERFDSLVYVWVGPPSHIGKGRQGSHMLKQYWFLPKLQQTDRENILTQVISYVNGPEAAPGEYCFSVLWLWGEKYLLLRHSMLPASLGCRKSARAVPFWVSGVCCTKNRPRLFHHASVHEPKGGKTCLQQ